MRNFYFSLEMIIHPCFPLYVLLLTHSSVKARYSTLFTMPYLLVAHYHETDSIQCEDSWFLRQIRALLRSIQVFLSY